MAQRAFIIGGTGQVGRAVAAELLAQGWEVTLASRRGTLPGNELTSPRATYVKLDREQPGKLEKALAGGADAVVDAVAYSEVHADQLLSLQKDVGAFVVLSSCSVYRDETGRTLDEAADKGFPEFPEPISEAQETVDPGPQTYSTRKIALERRLLDRADRPVTILRPGAIHGPYSSHPREWWFVKRMLDGRRLIPLTFGGESRLHTTATANLARLVRQALNHSGTRILNAADPHAPTSRQIGEAIAQQLNYSGRILPVDAANDIDDARMGSSPWSIPAPIVLSTASAQALGYEPAATYESAVGQICDWLKQESSAGGDWKAKFPVLAAYPGNLFDYAAEDGFLKKRGFL